MKEKVFNAVCQYFNVTPERVKSRWKHSELVKARMFTTYILRNADQFQLGKLSRYTFIEIADLLNRLKGDGTPDHSVPVHYHSKMDFYLLHYDNVRDDMLNILEQLGLTISFIRQARSVQRA